MCGMWFYQPISFQRSNLNVYCLLSTFSSLHDASIMYLKSQYAVS